MYYYLTGLIVGAIIRYAGSTNQVTHIDAFPAPNTKYNLSVPPDIVRFHFPDTIPISPGGNIKIHRNIYMYFYITDLIHFIS